MLLGNPATETEKRVMRRLSSLLIPRLPTPEELAAEAEAERKAAEAELPIDDEGEGND